MWIDERGSDVLEIAECRRLLAWGAKERRHGHLGINQKGAPLVFPVNFVVHGSDVVVVVGEGLFGRLAQEPMVAFQVDGIDDGRPWTVLVRGFAVEFAPDSDAGALPVPMVAQRGHRTVRIRGDAVSGRRINPVALTSAHLPRALIAPRS